MIITKYLAKEMFKTQIATLGVFTLILYAWRISFALRDVVAGNLEVSNLFIIVSTYIPNLLEIILPLSLFLGTLISLSRLYSEHEIDIILATGMSKMHIYKAISILVAVSFLLSAFNALYLTPSANSVAKKIMNQASSSAGVSLLKEGQFNPLGDYTDNSINVYVGGKEGDVLQNIFIAQLDEVGGLKPSITFSRTGVLQKNANGTKSLVLNDGNRYSNDNGSLAFRELKFKKMTYQFAQSVQSNQIDYDDISTFQLFLNNDSQSRNVLIYRFTIPLTIFVLGLYSLPLAYVRPRGSRFQKLPIALIIFMSYFIIIQTIHNSVSDGKISALSYVICHFVFGFFGVLLNLDFKRIFNGFKNNV